MTKPFFEVFPTLQMNSPLHDKLEQTLVARVSTTKIKDVLHIYLFSKRLILKEDIKKAEAEIRKQLFPNAFITIKIHERFELSSQYTPGNLMEIYRESILEELKDYTIYHFQDEEKYMLSIGYSGIEAQKCAHQVFVDRLNEINLDEVDENQQEYLEELVGFLRGWLINHILKMDKLIPADA